MRIDELEFDLPRELIATRPADPRDSARLMVLSRSDPGRLEHRAVRDLPELLDAGDLLVVNDTRVLPARFRGVNLESRGKVEGLWIRDAEVAGGPGWVAMLKARRHRPGYRIELLDREGARSGVVLEILERAGPEIGGEGWVVRLEGAANTGEALDRVGLAPLPPYILAARRDAGEAIDRPEDLDRYQTTFAGGEVGSVAAPTAGMHLTGGVFERLRGRGVERAEVTLHVGAGTFKPIETELVEAHPMHSEWCSMDGDAARLIFDERRAGRVVAVGSTSARTIESYAREVAGGAARPGFLETDLLITPGYRWRRVDALVTNFHLPRSTLLAMVASFLDQGGARGDGLERLLAVYAAAVREGYRFFSYGDAMVILP